ncbi:MAG: (2Fe-2S) ferredoxin domain-containing protein [Cyanobacteria bacterium]|nr:(2Fe-2S) ferredoxin domain-containing protein [Cyanobacteriota bacterium]MDW8200040.1 (2Fe-2S) ferredoxin domain-containing protein [Cyanobacteriota bacterium SKYGB_h_bin112]
MALSTEEPLGHGEFCCQGEIVDLVCKDHGRLKYLHLITESGLQVFKVSKYALIAPAMALVRGDRIQVTGWQTYNPKEGTVKRKVFQVTRFVDGHATASHEPENLKAVATAEPPAKPQRAKLPTILLCQKCLKKRGGGIDQALELALREHGLGDRVTVKYTGCMNQCKTGPHVVFMPDKAHYQRCAATMATMLVEQHILPHVQ